jgi:iron-sulfur cluster assembly accessory protein
MSLDLIDGSTVDYVDEMVKKSFVVTENPKADMTCGCGASFTPMAFK